jgi:hypothetical protein
MATIQPEGEQIRKAIKWISEEKQASPEKSHLRLLEEAGIKFNLSPVEEDYLAKMSKSIKK